MYFFVLVDRLNVNILKRNGTRANIGRVDGARANIGRVDGARANIVLEMVLVPILVG